MRSGTSLAWRGNPTPGGASASTFAEARVSAAAFDETPQVAAIAIGSAESMCLPCDRLTTTSLPHGSSEQSDSW